MLLTSARRALFSFNAKKCVIRVNQNAFHHQQHRLTWHNKQLFHRLLVVSDKTLPQEQQQDPQQSHKDALDKEPVRMPGEEVETSSTSLAEEEAARLAAEEEEERKYQEYKEYTRAPYLVWSTAGYIVLTSLFLAGVLFVDSQTNSGESNNTVLIANEESESQSVVARVFKMIQNEIQRCPAVYALLAVNTAVFLVARRPVIPAATVRLLENHFVMSVINVIHYGRLHTLLTMAFTHHLSWHFALNMLALVKMGPFLVASLGTPTFLAFYFGAAISSSIGSLIVKVLSGNYFGGSVGASGAIFAVILALAVILGDEARFNLLFMPNITFDPMYTLPLLFAGEMIFNRIQKRVSIDTAAHVTGALFGYLAMKLLMRQEHHNRPRYVTMNTRDFQYAGDVVAFRKHGRGVFTNGQCTYDGEFQSGLFHGTGKVEYPKLQVAYEGGFENGEAHGTGKISKFAVDSDGVGKWTTTTHQFIQGKLVE